MTRPTSGSGNPAMATYISETALLLFVLVQERVEMIMSRIHFRALDGVGDFRRQVLDPMNTTLKRPKAP